MKSEAFSRLDRRLLGLLSARLSELGLANVADPRKGKVKWRLRQVITSVLAGMIAGCKGLKEVEELTTEMGGGARNSLGIQRRLPDTTARDLLMALKPNDIRGLLRHSIKIAFRRKQLRPDLPLRIVSMDGKHSSTWLFDDPQAAEKFGQMQGSRAVVRTITSCLISTPARPCLDAHPIPPETNEMGAFQAALDALLANYERSLFDVVMYDSGACSLENATYIKDKGLDYVLCMRNIQPELLTEARRLLDDEPSAKATACSVEVSGGQVITRRIFLTDKMKGWNGWSHLQTVIRTECTREDKTKGDVSVENRYYLSSLTPDKMTGEQWIEAIRRRWSVENQCHNTFDKIFREDKRPWLMQPNGMVVVQLLRRLAYNIMALYRSVTVRSETKREQPWNELLRGFCRALIRSTVEAMTGVRRRNVALS